MSAADKTIINLDTKRQSVKKPQEQAKPLQPLPLACYSARIEEATTEDNTYAIRLNNQQLTKAHPAEGLLIALNEGDTVLCIELNGQWLITQLLQREQSDQTLLMQSSKTVEWVAPVMRFKALKEMELSTAGKLSLSANDFIMGALNTFVTQARTMLQQAKTFSLTTKGLMRLNGRQQLIVAEEDLRMDAKRINMG